MPKRGVRPGLAGLGFEFAAGVAGCTLAGYWIDKHFDSRPWGLLIGLGIGLVAGTYNMIRDALLAVRQPPGRDAAGDDPSAAEDRPLE